MGVSAAAGHAFGIEQAWLAADLELRIEEEIAAGHHAVPFLQAAEDGEVVTGPLAELVPDPVEEHPLVPVGPALFAVKPPEAETWAPVTFYELPTGERYLHFGVRATPRVSP